jgi:hypothetical protein
MAKASGLRALAGASEAGVSVAGQRCAPNSIAGAAAATRGIEYLKTVPIALPPDGRVIVHNYVRPAKRLGGRGFRAWLQFADDHLEACHCGFAPTHFRVKAR